jgi:hypothetical protein
MPLSKVKNRERMRLSRQTCVQPKYPLGFLYPDGRVRLPDMTVVQPKSCQMVKLWEKR